MLSYCSTTIKPKRKRRKRKDRPCLEFVESPIEKSADSVDYVTGEPIEFPTVRVNCQSSLQWVSPQIRKSERITRKRGKTNKTRRQNGESKLSNLTGDFSTILEYDDDDGDVDDNKRGTRTTRSYSRKLETSKLLSSDCTTTQKTNIIGRILHDASTVGTVDDSPSIPSCLSTPEMMRGPQQLSKSSSAIPSNSMHYLFKAQTPVLRDVVVLVENTPL